MLTHHAYYIEGSLSEFGAYKAHLHPFWAREYERFGVDEAREFIALLSLKNFAAATFLIGASSITSEAQQALLKLLEEPQEGTTIVLLLPHGSLLPTVLSRMLAFPESLEATGTSSLSAKNFLKMTGKDRSDFITKLLKDDDGVKDRVRDFVNAIERELVGGLQKSEKSRQGLEDIAMVRDYLSDRAPSMKMLLEHLALALPVV